MRVALVVPTLGRSPLLGECLRALRREAAAEPEAELIVVAQGAGAHPELAAGLGHRRIDLPRPVGFAAAVNRGIAAAEAPFVAVVNDDAVVEPGWLGALLAALAADPGAAAAQGVNLRAADPGRVDGWGLAWNGRLQAVQLGCGEEAPPAGPEGGAGDPAGAAPREVFGVSATAAVYRREALLAVALPRRRGGTAPEVFDAALGTYYEDADLASRLRAAGYRALSVPAARARHGGSLTAGAGAGRWRRVYGNRYLVAARLLGRSFWRFLPRMAARDLADLAAAAARGEPRRAAGIVLGWGRAARRLPAFARGGPPALAPEDLLASAGPAEAR